MRIDLFYCMCCVVVCNSEHCAYVQQDDALAALLTVEETVMFHAHLRLPALMSWKEKQERVRVPTY